MRPAPQVQVHGYTYLGDHVVIPYSIVDVSDTGGFVIDFTAPTACRPARGQPGPCGAGGGVVVSSRIDHDATRVLGTRYPVRAPEHPEFARIDVRVATAYIDGVLYLRAADVEDYLAQHERRRAEDLVERRNAGAPDHEQNIRTASYLAMAQVLRERFAELVADIRRRS